MANQKRIQEMAGQLIVAGFEGVTLPRPTADSLASGQIGGCILFRRNVENIGQLAALNRDIHRRARELPPFVAVDQEGGRVVRVVEGVTPLPPMRRVGQLDHPRRALELAEVMAAELATLGFNVNFAPVLDLDTNPDNPVIGDRSFGASPKLVSRLGAALILGHLTEGVIPCAKHFPGHGDTDTDSHHTLPVVRHCLKKLRSRELIPFEHAVERGVPMVMTAHILLSRIDADHPATLSRTVLSILRDELGFDGVIVSDDLEMAAVADAYPIEELVRMGLEAGVDLFLICHSPDKQAAAFEALVRLAEEDPAVLERLRQSHARVVTLKRGLLAPGPWEPDPESLAKLNCEAHRKVVEAVRGCHPAAS